MNMKVFQPITIQGMELKNRIGFPPFGNMPTGEHGVVSDQTIRWYADRARGGAALIMTGPLRVSRPRERAQMANVRVMKGFGIDDDSYIPGFARLAGAVHEFGAKLGAYIGSGGPVTGKGPSPSPYPDEQHAKDDIFYVTRGRRVSAREVSVEEIEQTQHEVAAAAARAKAAGVDFVNLACAHGAASLHGSFLSPFYNRRTDGYGGTWEGRLRIILETIGKVRAAVGQGYPIFIRISADEFMGSRGITLEDTTRIIVPALEKAGVDCIDISQGTVAYTMEGTNIPLYYPRGCFIHLAAAVKKVTSLPVIGVGNIFDLDMAERFLREKKADIIYMGRQLTADPETPKKYFEGRPEDVRKCIGCQGGCGTPCVVNYDMQDEAVPLAPASRPRKVMVVGGGIAGMEAARIAALRGHKVTLVEKESRLGGMVGALALTRLTAEFGNLVNYLETQMRKLKVDVRLCHAAAAGDCLENDVVIVAAGSSMVVPEAARGKPGVMTHIEACRRQSELGHRVVIWGLAAAELALSLAQDGKDVIIMGRGGEDTLARDYPMSRRFWVLRKLTDINVVRETPEAARVANPAVLYHIEVENVDGGRIDIRDAGGLRRSIPYDTLIISRERVANATLFDELQGKVTEVHRIGDCSQAGDIKQAIWDANEVARKI